MKSDWNEYKKLILHEMQENGQKFTLITIALQNMEKGIGELKSDVGALKVKAAIVGGVAGLVGTGILSAALSAFK